jgi:hypothetical protein
MLVFAHNGRQTPDWAVRCAHEFAPGPVRSPNGQTHRCSKSNRRRRTTRDDRHANAVAFRSRRARDRRHRALCRRPRLRDRARTRARRAAGALRQAAPDVDRASEPSHRHSARGGTAQPAHADQARLCGRRRGPPLLPAPARALVQPRVSVRVANRRARATDPRPAGRISARSVLARDARWRRDRLPHAVDVVADHVADPQCGAPPAGLLHFDRRRGSCHRPSMWGAACPRTALRSVT